MRVKDKHSNHFNAEVVSPSKKHTEKLSPEEQGSSSDNKNGTSETDALHRRLLNESSEGGVQDMAKSVTDLMETSSSPSKGGTKNQSKKKSLSPQKKEEAGAVTNELVSNPGEVAKVAAKRKKKVQSGNKKSGKKKALKKSFDRDEFEIDPRLGGSKIKQSINKKLKGTTKSKVAEQETKKSKVADQRFPYVHVEGAWSLPTVVKIVNGHVKEDENEGKITSKLTKAAQYIDEEHRNKVSKVGFTSTLSDRYDAQNRDVTWVCVFCQQYTHVQGLGDLYGPYYVNKIAPEPCFKKTPKEPISTEATRVTPKKSKKSPKKKGQQLQSPTLAMTTDVSPDVAEPRVQSPEEKTEVWFHESCLVWAPGVCLVPPRLVGLDEAVADSRQMVCEYCQKIGGHIFCRVRGCGLCSHFPCAVGNGWGLQEEDFMAFCPAHLKGVLPDSQTKTIDAQQK